jgi:putative aldouronate transport system permease protein
MNIRSSASERAFDAFNVLLMAVVAVCTLYPFYYIVINSLNDPIDAARGGIFAWPRAFSTAGYQMLLRDPTLVRALVVTVARTLTGTLASVFFTGAFAYGVSKKELVGRPIILGMMMITLYFSGGMIPNYILIRDLGLKGNFLVYILPLLFNAFNVIIMMSFFRTIPNELEESAKIDGAGSLRTFFRIIVPVSTPVLATIALYNGVAQWNSWYDAMLFGGRELPTLQLLLVNTIQANSNATSFAAQTGLRAVTSESLKLATMVVTAIPIMCSYPFLQRYFVKGMMIGSIKG